MSQNITLFYERILKRFFDYLQPKLFVMGLIGTFGYPLYYFVWHDIFPQSYESLSFRLICACSTIPWLFYKKLNRVSTFLQAYFFVTLFLCLPVFFGFMLIKNDFSALWMMSFITQFILLYLLIYNIGMIYFMSLTGFLFAGGLVYFQDGAIPFSLFSMEYIPVLLFMVFTSVVFYRHEIDHSEKKELLKSMSASIAHETRNPLQVIDVSVGEIRSMVEDHMLNEEGGNLVFSKSKIGQLNEFLQLLERSSGRANLVIDILLNNIKNQSISQLDYGVYTINDIVDTAINDYAFKTDEASFVHSKIVYDFTLKGDKSLLIYVFFNLFKNALYVLSSEENPRIDLWGSVEESSHLLHFKDNGTGIPKSIEKNLFEGFVTQGNSNGTGLGLSFCLEAMKSMGGNITCKSEWGYGTEFILRFPKVKNK